MDVPEIDELLAQDEANVPETKRLLVEFSPHIPEAINSSCSLYTTINRVWGQAIDDHFGEIEALLAKHGFESDRELVPLIESDDEVRSAYARFESRDVRGALLVRLGVLNSQIFADLFRVRVTAPFAYLRVQVESVALVAMMTRVPEVAVEWTAAGPGQDGVAFFRRHQKEVKRILEELNLYAVYDLASGTALHSRFAGLAQSFKIEHTSVDGRWERKTRVLAQEFDPDNPIMFLMTAVYAIKAQDLIIAALLEILPELDDPILRNERVPSFRRVVNEIVGSVQKYRPRERADASDAA